MATYVSESVKNMTGFTSPPLSLEDVSKIVLSLYKRLEAVEKILKFTADMVSQQHKLIKMLCKSDQALLESILTIGGTSIKMSESLASHIKGILGVLNTSLDSKALSLRLKK